MPHHLGSAFSVFSTCSETNGRHITELQTLQKGLLPRQQLTHVFIPSQQAHQIGWRGRYKDRRCSPPLARSACTEKQAWDKRLASWREIMTQRLADMFSYLVRFSDRVQSDEVHLKGPLFFHGQR